MSEAQWTVRGSRESLRAVRPLIDAHASLRSVAVEEVPDLGQVEFLAGGVTGRLPEDLRLRRFAEAAAAVCKRQGPAGPIALLAQWDERAHQAAEQAAQLLPRALFWPARIITGRDLPAALGIGVGAAVYFGHGHCGGWDGYWGIHAEALISTLTETAGAVFSLTCMANQRPPGRLSFHEELVLSGFCASAFGSAGRTCHRRNRVLGLALCRAMQTNATVADVVRNCQASWLSRVAYTIAGDPLASLSGSPRASERAAEIERRFWPPISAAN